MRKIITDDTSIKQLGWAGTWLNILFGIQLLSGLIYAYFTGAIGNRPTHFFIPFIWITVAVWVLWHTRPVSTQRSFQFIAAAVAAMYFLVLLYLSGLIGQGTSHLEPLVSSYGIGMVEGQSLGWGPILLYTGEWLTVYVIPYQAIGLFALSYLVYNALLGFARSTVGGIIGVAACPACVGPLLAPLLASGAGGSSLVLVLGIYGYEIATILFILSIAVLYHRHALAAIYPKLRSGTG